MAEYTPAPLLGCLICHAEGTLTLLPRPAWQVWEKHPSLTCSNCGAVANLDWLEGAENWAIRYRSIPNFPPYLFAHLKFRAAGWVMDDEALALSTQVYIQRQYLKRLEKGQLDWLKPQRLSPPPPLMSPDEQVYLTLKPVSYVEVLPTRWINRPKQVILDSGTCYITDTKIHLLGQQRDRSHRLTEITRLDYEGERWLAQLNVSERVYAYQGMEMGDYDAELISLILLALQKRGH